jgi:hypothetical protein
MTKTVLFGGPGWARRGMRRSNEMSMGRRI